MTFGSSTRLAALLGGVALANLATVPAIAHVVEISNVTGSWLNAVPPSVVSYTGNGTADPSARWGVPAGSGGQSGYDFDAATPPAIDITVPPSPSPDFTLGTFTHVNQPINSGTSITGIQLQLKANVAVDGVSQGNLSFLFDFAHDETPNTAPCPYGPSGLTGVNVNGCADHVAVSYNALSQSFTIGTDQYTLDILGFQIGGVTQTAFLTEEDANDSAPLVAVVTLTSQAVTNQLVPEPASMLLLGAGVAGLGLIRRR